MPLTRYSSATKIYIDEFLNDSDNIPEWKVNYLKNHFYYFVEKYIDVKRENLLIGTIKNKQYLYFQCKLNPTIHFITNLNDPTCNYLKFDYPTCFIEKLNQNEFHYKKYKTIKKYNNSENCKRNCKLNCICVIV